MIFVKKGFECWIGEEVSLFWIRGGYTGYKSLVAGCNNMLSISERYFGMYLTSIFRLCICVNKKSWNRIVRYSTWKKQAKFQIVWFVTGMSRKQYFRYTLWALNGHSLLGLLMFFLYYFVANNGHFMGTTVSGHSLVWLRLLCCP